jgi:hypothetical protein
METPTLKLRLCWFEQDFVIVKKLAHLTKSPLGALKALLAAFRVDTAIAQLCHDFELHGFSAKEVA